MWYILENVSCALEKKVYSSAFGWNVLKISMRSISSNVSFKTCVSSLIFCFDDLSFGVSGVLNSPTIVLLQFLLLCLLVFVLFIEVLLCWVHQFSSVQLLSHVRLCPCQSSLSITNSRSLPKLMTIESMMPTSHLILCLPLLLLPTIPPNIRVFSNESTLRIRWSKYWSFSFSISPSNEHPGLISFRMDWLDFLAVQGTLKCLLQHHSSKASILQHSAFFTVQLSHPHMTTGKTIALTRWTFVGKVISLLFNMHRYL